MRSLNRSLLTKTPSASKIIARTIGLRWVHSMRPRLEVQGASVFAPEEPAGLRFLRSETACALPSRNFAVEVPSCGWVRELPLAREPSPTGVQEPIAWRQTGPSA